MDQILLSNLPQLSDHEKSILQKGNVKSVGDLALAVPQDLARRCGVATAEIMRLVRTVCDGKGPLTFHLPTLEEVKSEGNEKFSTGDPVLDTALGGGIRTGMVWEIVGESAAGKTQFALQFSLYVQLPPEQNGLGGSVCYLTTSAKLQTTRLVQILEARQISASLEDVHTLSTPTTDVLLSVLEHQLPTFINKTANSPGRKPVKLLIIDALAELFHVFKNKSTATLVERSQQLTRISTHLHRLADEYKVAIVVLNEVADAFDNHVVESSELRNRFLLYHDQARWFGRAHSIQGENRKEASLGLVWANRINARIMVSRTGRRRYIVDVNDNDERDKDKRRKIGEGDVHSSTSGAETEATLIRRLTVIFNSAGPTTSCDYIVTGAGVKGLVAEKKEMKAGQSQNVNADTPAGGEKQPQTSDHSAQEPQDLEEDYDDFWKGDEFYENVDWDVLEQTLTQAQTEPGITDTETHEADD